MPERERPPIKDKFSERLARIAERLYISKQECEIAQIREFLELVAKIEDLQEEIAIRERGQDLTLSAITKSANVTPLADRYWRAENLLRATLAVVEEGLGEPESDLPKYIAEKVRTAIQGFGLEVVKKETKTPSHALRPAFGDIREDQA